MRVKKHVVWVSLSFLLAIASWAGCGGDSDNDCQPKCTGKQCGDDGCGGNCGTCDTGQTCNAQDQCVSCTPNCTDKQCGDDGCGSSCGTCKTDQTCNAQGQCVGGADVSPASGVWHYSEYSASKNDCDSEQLISNGDGTFRLTNHGDGTFTIDPTDGTDPFDCTVTGLAFSCPNRAMVGVDLRPDYDAELTATASVSGTFSDEKTMSGQQTAEATCEGTACDAVASHLGIDFPCEFVIDFQATWRLGF